MLFFQSRKESNEVLPALAPKHIDRAAELAFAINARTIIRTPAIVLFDEERAPHVAAELRVGIIGCRLHYCGSFCPRSFRLTFFALL